MRGHIRKRGNKYAIIVYLGVDPQTGKKRQKWFSGYKSEKEAEDDLPNVLLKAQEFSFEEEQRQKFTLNEMFDIWVNKFARRLISKDKQNISENTLETYIYTFDKHIKDTLGKEELDDITQQDIQSFVDSQEGSSASVRKRYYLLKNIFDYAEKRKHVKKSPCNNVELPKIIKKPAIKTWNKDTFVYFLKLLSTNEELNKLFMPFCLALTTGLRRGEICALEWKAYNSDLQTIRVVQSMTRKGIVKEHPKTSSSFRVIKLLDYTIPALNQQKEWQKRQENELGKDYINSGFICTMEDGRPMKPEYLTKRFAILKERYDLPEIRFHDLRHTFATLGLEAGIDIKTLSETLGHSTTKTTTDIYMHVNLEMKEHASNKLSNYVFGEK